MSLTRPGRRATVNRAFKWVLIASFGLHFGIFGAVVYAQKMRPKNKVTDAIPVELVRLGKPRDPNLLPRKVRHAAPPPVDDAVKLDTGKKPPPPSKRTPAPKKAPPKMSDAARRMLSTANDDALDDALAKIEEPEGSPDGVAEGTTTDPARAARGYAALAGASLKRAYRLPDLLKAQQQFLSADILIHVAADGRIQNYEIVKRHNNDLFMSALESLLKSHQLPAPPKELVDKFRNEGILLKFKP